MSSDLRLHVVSFDVPFPPNYGGVIDVYYKIAALHQLGVRVILHAFQYGRPGSDALDEVCEKVYFYNRNHSSWLFLRAEPFIVSSRRNPLLLSRLLEDEAPILFEGLHCGAYLDHPALRHRHKILRTHNVEHVYYALLAHSESNWRTRQYYAIEARRLRRFEKVLKHAQHTACISPADTVHFQSLYGNAHHISAFHPFERVAISHETEPFVLYHGNLSVAENNFAAQWLLENVFNKISVPFKIIGRGASNELRAQAHSMSHVELIEGLTTEDIHDYIGRAHINLLPTFQATGIKLKLLAALHIGHHCIVNTPMVENTGLEELCSVLDDPDAMAQCIRDKMEEPFGPEAVQQRIRVLGDGFSNRVWAQKLKRLLFPDRE